MLFVDVSIIMFKFCEYFSIFGYNIKMFIFYWVFHII